MYYAVYLTLFLPLLAMLAVRLLVERLEPRLATWLVTGSAVALAGASTGALSLLMLRGLVRIPAVAEMGQWSLLKLQRYSPSPVPEAFIAAALLGAVVIATGRAARRRSSALMAAAHEANSLPGEDEVVVIDDSVAEAFTLPGAQGRIVVSTAMLAALEAEERDALIAHELTHLRCRHYLFVSFAQLAAVANPLLRPLATAVSFTVERWADESAATVTGNRRRVALTLGKAALAATRTGGCRRTPAAALHVIGPLAGSGPVPRRVAALLSPAPRFRLLPLIAIGAVLAMTGICAVDAASDMCRLLKLAHATG